MKVFNEASNNAQIMVYHPSANFCVCVCVFLSPSNKADNMLSKSFRKILHEHKTVLKQNGRHKKKDTKVEDQYKHFESVTFFFFRHGYGSLFKNTCKYENMKFQPVTVRIIVNKQSKGSLR